MTDLTNYVKLLAKREGTYTTYVFQNLDKEEYIMCTKLPNWNVPEVDIGDIGYLQYKEVLAGDVFVNAEGEVSRYRYPNVYFINFINRSVSNKKEIIL